MRQKMFGLFAGALLLAIESYGPAGVSAADKLPVATGEFRILLAGKRIGQEQFRLFKSKGYRLESTATVYWPEPSRQEYTYQFDGSFRPEKLDVRVTRAGLLTSVEVRQRGRNWRSEIKGKGRKTVQQELGRREGAELDFGSLLFNWVTARRLNLSPGEERKVDAIVLELPALAGKRAQQVYKRLPDEEIETEGRGKVLASVYESNSGETTHRIWVDASGFPVRSKLDLPAGPVESILVRLQAKPGAW